MAGHPPPTEPPRRPLAARVRGYLPRVILDALMSVAVIVLERRIRRALRSDAEPG